MVNTIDIAIFADTMIFAATFGVFFGLSLFHSVWWAAQKLGLISD